MKRTRCIFWALPLALLPAVACWADASLTLPDSIDAALTRGYDAKVLAGNLAVARAQHELAVAKNSFTVTGSAGYTQPAVLDPGGVYKSTSGLSNGLQAGATLGGPLTSVVVTPTWYAWPVPELIANGITSNPSSALSVSASQILWNGYPGGTTKATVDKSALALQGKELSAAASRLSIIYGVKQAYYTMLAAQRNVDLKKRIVDKQDAVLAQIQSVYDMKLESLVNLKTAQVNARSARVDLDGAAHDLRFARTALALLMGMDQGAQFTVADAPDPAVPVQTVEEAVSQALAQRAELKQLALSLKSDAVDLSLARGQATPTVTLSGTFSMGLSWADTMTNYETATLGVKLGMPISDAGAVSDQVRAIQRQDEVYALQDAQLRKSIENAVRGAWDSLRIAREKVDLARLSVEASELQREITTVQHDNGTASTQDMLTATVNAANAQNNLAAAGNAAQLAALSLLSLMGY